MQKCHADEMLETDYLVVGAGASGMAFADSLISASPDADVVIIDRRHGPGGHWNDAYPFIRLHQPSAYYGVNSLPLGTDSIDASGVNAGMYERASGHELCAYYERVMKDRLLASGRVRFFPYCDYSGHGEFVSLLTGETYAVSVRKSVVDGAYLEPTVPATTAYPFETAEGVRCVPVNELARVPEPPDGFVIVGAGKTGADAILHLLDCGVPPDLIRWIKPREAWYLNRTYTQGGELLATLFEGLSRQMEVCADASSSADLFDRLQNAEQMLRISGDVTPTMFRGPTISTAEVELLSQVTNVIRLGRVRRIDEDAIHLDDGRVPTSRAMLHVHAAAGGLNPAAEVPIFAPGQITLQSMRIGLASFNSALIAYVEATRSDIPTKNRLCPPNRQPDKPGDWIRGTLVAAQAEYRWAQEDDIAIWIDGARVNIAAGVRRRLAEPDLGANVTRYLTSIGPAVENLQRLASEAI